MQNTIEQLNFKVMLDTSQFDDTIKSVEDRAKKFNTSLSQSLDIQKKVEKVMNATTKASAKSAAEREREAQSFSKYIDQLRKMEEQGQRLANQMPKAFNWSHHIDQTYMELNRLMGILQKIQERQASGARIQYSDEYINKITAAGEGALRAITALEEAQKRLTSPSNGFQEHIRNLTQTNTTLLQMREHYSALEKDSARAAKETEKMYSSQAKATKEAQKQLPIGRSMESLAAERAAIEKRIAENIANEGKELSKIKTAEGTRAADAKMVADAQQKVSKLIEDCAKKQAQHRAEVVKTTNSLMSARSILSTISQLTGIYFGAMGARRFLSSMIEITGQFEVQRMALRNMLQDIDAADKIFDDLYRFSSDSTYRFSELAKYAKQLAAFNIPKDDLLETTKMLGDVASGVGVSMDRLINAYGHVKSSGFLRGIQLRSFSQNGVPVLEELSKILSEVEGKAVSLGDVFDKMTKRQIPFDMVEEAFRRMTSEGGKFYQMQEVLAKTLSGQINILKGRWENMLATIGESNSGFIKGTVERLNDLVLNYEKLGKLIGEIAITWGVYRAAVIATTLVTDGLTAATNIGLLKALKNVGKWIMSNPWAVLAAAVTLCTMEIIKASKELSGQEKIIKALNDVTDDYNRSVEDEIGELDALFGALRNAREGTEEYAAAKSALENRFDPYIQKLREEGVEVSNLTTLYDGLAKKIIEANKQMFLEKAQDQITDAYHNATKAINDRLEALMNNIGNLNADQRGALRHYLRTGEMTEYFKSIPNLDSRRTPGPYEGPTYNKEIDNKTFREQLSELRLEYDRDTQTFTDAMADAAKEFDAAINATAGKTTAALKEWRRTVQTTLYTIDDKFEKSLMPKEDEDYFEYLERIGKHYKEVNEYKDKALEKDKRIYEQELEAIKKVDAALEGNILKDVRYTREPWKGGSGDTSDPFAKEISETRAKISVLEKYKSAYDKLEAVFGDDAENEFEKLFPGKDLKKTDEDLEKLIDHLETLGENGKTAAESIRASLGLDDVSKAIKEYKAAQKALSDYEKAIGKFDKDWGEGDSSGALFKAEGILRKYTNEKKKIEDDWDELKKAAVKSNKELTKSEIDLYEARKKANENTMMEGIRGLVDDIFKEKFKGKELSDWSHKTLSDIRGIKKTVEDMELPPEIKKMVLEKGGENALEELQKAFAEYKQNLIDGTVDPELFKKMARYAKQVAQYISKAGDAMKKLGEATDDSGLSDAGEAISAIGQTLSAAADGYEKTGSWIGAVAGGVVDIFNQVTEAVAGANQKMKEMQDTIRNIRIEAENARFDKMISGNSDTIFGENFIERVKSAVNALDELKKSVSGLEESRRSFFEWEKKLEARNPSHGTYGMIENYVRGLETPDFANMLFRTDHSFWKGDTFKSLSDIAAEFGMELEDVNGNLNPKLLDEVLKLYGDLNEGAKDWLTGAINYSEQYQEALEQIEDATKDIFDGLASDMADKFIDNFLQMGNAVDDLSDTFANLGDAILRSFLQSYILDEILGKYKEMATDALKQYSTGEMTPEDYAAWLDGFAQSVKEESETLAPAINGMIEAFKDRGLMNIDENTANSIGSGIKGITEDTANLLASYINAMRADVSSIRMMQEAGWQNVSSIGASLPTLNDYLAQVAANTFDSAQNTQRILSELQSVIGAPGTSGMVVRVEAS